MEGSLSQQLSRIVAGEQAAKLWWFDTFAGHLSRRLELRYGHAGYELEDLLHDAFVFYFQHEARVIAKFLERHASEEITEELIERYLWDLVGGLVANRRRANRRSRFEELDGRTLATTQPDPQRAALSKDTVAQLADCIGERNPRLLLYSRLRYFDGFEPDEIATIAGWSRKTTYKLKLALNEALIRCAQALDLGPR
jgi:DNA-directed RNA polymerase specialized sigma24 family protein